MKIIYYFSILSVLVLTNISCADKKTEKTDNVQQTVQTEDLSLNSVSSIIGRKIKVEYPTMQAEMTYTSDSTLHWKTIDNGIVAEGDENVAYKAIAKDMYFINWIENDGITVSQVVDFKKNIISVFMSYHDPKSVRGQRAGDLFEGKITILN